MKSCLILGSGRSGTSMVAGALNRAGYFMGKQCHPGNALNPKGFFEDKEINRINEELLAQVTAKRPEGPLGYFYRHRPVHGQRWLAVVPVGTPIPCPPALAQRIVAQTAHRPFCFKDPRFSYTLPAWRPFVGDALFVCVFREPLRSAHSMVKATRELYPQREVALTLDVSRALSVWTSMYENILSLHSEGGDWLFVHYDQMLDGSAIRGIEERLQVQLDRQFAEEQLKHSLNDGETPTVAQRVYDQLCRFSGFSVRQEPSPSHG